MAHSAIGTVYSATANATHRGLSTRPLPACSPRRVKAGLPQSEVARRVGRRQAFIWRLENAQQSPDATTLVRSL